MQASIPRAFHSSRRLRPVFLAPLLGGLLLAACGSAAKTVPSQSGITGIEVPKPGAGGATIFVDANAAGATTSFRIQELLFGRLVDIHDIDGGGLTNETPIFKDYLVEMDLLGNGSYRLENNPLTGAERLVILVQRSMNPTGFSALLSAASDNLEAVVQHNDDGLDSRPVSAIPRNCSVSIRFNDMLNDSPAAVVALADNVRLLIGNRPSQPFFARLLFDPNHGAILNGSFHSTRVLVDFAVSDAEAFGSGGALQANAVGLPAGDSTTDPNVSIRIPTRIVATTQPTLLTSVSGRPLDSANNGPARANASLDVVRAFRPSSIQLNNGFMPDNVPPQIMGSWDVAIATAGNNGAGTLGFDFLLNLQFSTVCRSAMEVGDMIEMGTHMLRVTRAAAPDGAGTIPALEVRSLVAIADPNDLLGTGLFVSPLDPSLTGIDGCWIGFDQPVGPTISGVGPVTDVTTTAQLNLRFSEPMDPVSVSLLDRVVLMAGNMTTIPTAHNRVAGSYEGDASLTKFTLVHPLPFAHAAGMQETYTLGVPTPAVNLPVQTMVMPTDLAGNAITNPLPPVEFRIAMSETATSTGSTIFRFDCEYRSPDEPFAGVNEVNDPTTTTGGQRRADFSGDFIYDTARGEIRGREVAFQSYVIDGSKPSVMGMLPGALGVSEPLNRLGAKTQTLWRLFDMGMFSNQSSSLDVDVVGLNWVPQNEAIFDEFYPNFEIRLGTSRKLPDESVTMMVLDDAESGLDPTMPFSASSLGTPGSLVTVHERTKGYAVRKVDLFPASTGTTMIPFPLNQGLGPGQSMTTFTWRNSADLNTSDQVIDIPSPADVFFNAGTLPVGNLESESLGAIHGSADNIQAAVLPLLMEFNCFTASNAIGSNRFSVGLLAPFVDGSLRPISRIFSSGGTNSQGFPQMVNPDSAQPPSGGYNPVTGIGTLPGDNVYYLGQLDTVYRVTRLVSHWIDLTGVIITGDITFSAPMMEPAPSAQPLGTSIQLAFRSATGFADNMVRPFDPSAHGPNGDPVDHFANGSVHSINFQSESMVNNTVSGRIWNSNITQMKSRFLQVRITFVNNIDAGTRPYLSALAFPFEM